MGIRMWHISMYIHTFMHICIFYVYTLPSVRVVNLYTCMYEYMYVPVCVCVCVSCNTHTHTHTLSHTHTQTMSGAQSVIHTRVCVCVRLYMNL